MRVQEDRVDRLYRLLPSVSRMRDHELGEPLRALLQVIGEQVGLVEDDIAQLYDDWFIETCADPVVPRIGDLVGHRLARVDGHASAAGDTSARGAARGRLVVSRRDVANTIRYRRRKGTLALLERLARDVAGWPAHAVEVHRRLAHTQSLRHPHPERGRTASLRDVNRLDLLGGAFDTLAHAVDVRRSASRYRRGWANQSGIGVFVWRLRSYPVTSAPAYCVEELGPHAYMFSALGNDTPLFVRPRVSDGETPTASELDLPVPIRRQALKAHASDIVGQSLTIWADGWPGKGHDTDRPIPTSQIIVADLGTWAYTPPRDHVAVDPVRGRFMFPPRQAPRRSVRVSYHYGFSADMGGGEYVRPLREAEGAQVIRVTGQEELRAALEPWQRHVGEGTPAPASTQPAHAVIELTDSGVYVVPLTLWLAAGHSLQIRAAQRTRPVIRLLDWQTDRPDSLSVGGGKGSRFTLDGVMVAGRGVQVDGELASLTIRHATLVPGWSLQDDCEPRRPAEPSIEIINSNPCVVIDHSIVGSIQVNHDEVSMDPVRIRVSDSIVDATGSGCDGPECEAIGAAGAARAHVTLRMLRSTVIGRVMTHAIELAENSIFVGQVLVARRQIGCMRFCHVPPSSRTPRRFHCQPDLARRAVVERMRAEARSNGQPLPSEADVARVQAAEVVRVRPQFNSLRYGMPTYCQLSCACADEITWGADDESEMGAFHDLFQPQRLENLRARADEYTPAGLEAGIVLVNQES